MKASPPCLITLVLIGGLAQAIVAVQPPTLTGTWIPDSAASTQSKELKQAVQPGAPPAPPAPPATIRDHLPTLRIHHGEPRLTLQFLDADGSVISTTEVTTDGKENMNSRAGGALVHRSTSRWDGNTLRTDWKIERDAAVVISGVDRTELTSADTLVVTTTTEDSKSRSRSTIVYHRAKG